MNYQIMVEIAGRWHPFTQLRFFEARFAEAFCNLVIKDRLAGGSPFTVMGFREHNPQLYEHPYGPITKVERN